MFAKGNMYVKNVLELCIRACHVKAAKDVILTANTLFKNTVKLLNMLLSFVMLVLKLKNVALQNIFINQLLQIGFTKKNLLNLDKVLISLKKNYSY